MESFSYSVHVLHASRRDDALMAITYPLLLPPPGRDTPINNANSWNLTLSTSHTTHFRHPFFICTDLTARLTVVDSLSNAGVSSAGSTRPVSKEATSRCENRGRADRFILAGIARIPRP
jgi:hypothetical protein